MMGYFQGSELSERIDISAKSLNPGETGHFVSAKGGSDTVIGSSYTDIIQGEAGNDILYGNGGNDTLVGGDGNDTLYGGNGNDSVFGGAGTDALYGGEGDDIMYGGTGNDYYYHYAGDGVDIINDNKSPTGAIGYGGGTSDIVYLLNVSSTNLFVYSPSGKNDLWLTSEVDISDGELDDGVIIEDFFLGGANVVEYLMTSDNIYFNLSSLL
jgi:Ca2+-binding RTX toxin-like protein